MADAVGGGVDRISGLPDHLLHSILLLVRGGTAADAARTSALSRRWRHVWAHLPELALCYEFKEASYARAHRHIDDALAAYSAPTIRRLRITVPYGSAHLTADRLSSWLHFAARRLAGGLWLSVPHDVPEGDTEELVLPLWETVTSISLDFLMSCRTLRFAVGGAAAFTALAALKIRDARVDGRELEHVLSSRCPGLKELVLTHVGLWEGDAAPGVFSIRSASLQRLQMACADGFDGLLRVAAPELQVLTLYCIHGDAYIAAPKLSELYWYDESFYDPTRHRFAAAGRHIRRMMVATGSATMALMNRFDIVDELDMTVYVRQGVHRYNKLLEDTSRLAKCEVLLLTFDVVKHDFKPIMVHLLQQCAGIRKLVVEFTYKMGDRPCKLWGCPCSRIENRKTDRIVLHSLERVEVKGDGEAEHEAELVRMLCKCHATFKKKVSIYVRTTYTLRKISRIVHPNDKYEITVCQL